MIIKQFREPVFKTDVIFIVDAEPEEVEAYISKRFPHDGEVKLSGYEGCCFRCDKYELKYYVVWMRDSSRYYTLTHEVLHLVEWRFKDLGVKFEGEQACYYQEYWVRKLWKEISKINPITQQKSIASDPIK